MKTATTVYPNPRNLDRRKQYADCSYPYTVDDVNIERFALELLSSFDAHPRQYVSDSDHVWLESVPTFYGYPASDLVELTSRLLAHTEREHKLTLANMAEVVDDWAHASDTYLLDDAIACLRHEGPNDLATALERVRASRREWYEASNAALEAYCDADRASRVTS